MRDFLAIVPMRDATPDDFELLAALFGRPTKRDKAKQAEIKAAEKDLRDAIQAAYKLPKLADMVDAKAEANAVHAARVEEIERRYALAPLRDGDLGLT